MTKPLNHTDNGTPFGLWLRQQAELDSRRYHLSIQNIDYVHHGFKLMRNSQRVQAVMLLEEKRYLAKPDFAQIDTLKLIHQALQYADGQQVVNVEGESLPLHYFGYHIIQFENTTPDDGYVLWNGECIERDILCQVLRFKLDPRLIGQQAL